MNIKTKALLLTLIISILPAYLLLFYKDFERLSDFSEFIFFFSVFVYFSLLVYFLLSRISDFLPKPDLGQEVLVNLLEQDNLHQYNRSLVGILISFIYTFLIGFGAKIYTYQTGETDVLDPGLFWLTLLSFPGMIMMFLFLLRSFFFIIKYFLHEKKTLFFTYIFVVSFIYYYLFL